MTKLTKAEMMEMALDHGIKQALQLTNALGANAKFADMLSELLTQVQVTATINLALLVGNGTDISDLYDFKGEDLDNFIAERSARNIAIDKKQQ